MKTLSVTIQMKATEQYFNVVLFIINNLKKSKADFTVREVYFPDREISLAPFFILFVLQFFC